LITDTDAAYLAILHTGRPLFPCTTQIAFESLLTGFIEVNAFGFKRTSCYAEPAAGATFRVNVYDSFFPVHKHGHFFLGTGIITRVVRTMLAGIYMMFQ
jgi:hypothetical protein